MSTYQRLCVPVEWEKPIELPNDPRTIIHDKRGFYLAFSPYHPKSKQLMRFAVDCIEMLNKEPATDDWSI